MPRAHSPHLFGQGNYSQSWLSSICFAVVRFIIIVSAVTWILTLRPSIPVFADAPAFNTQLVIGQWGRRYDVVAIGDVDGDGTLDVVSATQDVWKNSPNTVHLNDGSGHFTEKGFGEVPNLTTSLALGDLDGDGDLDIVTGNISATHPVVIYLNDGKGTFTKTHELGPAGVSYIATALGDMDGNGFLDVIVRIEHRQTTVYLNEGAGSRKAGNAQLELVQAQKRRTAWLSLT